MQHQLPYIIKFILQEIQVSTIITSTYFFYNIGKAIRQDFGLSIVNSTPRPKKIISAQQEGFEYCIS